MEYTNRIVTTKINIARRIIALAFSAVLFAGAGRSLALAGPVPVQSSPPPTAQNSTVLATVNIQDAKIVSQSGNTFHISFNFSNREGIQNGVKYGVQIAQETKTGHVIVDEKVYPETLILAEHSTVAKQISYTAPANLGGTYGLFLVSKNGSGFPLALAFVSKVKLTATEKGLAINPGSCYLQVAGEKGSPHYNLTQGVDIAPTEKLMLTCTATNETSSALSAVPSFETHYRTLYGDIVSTTGGDDMAVSFAAGEKKTFSITLPKAVEPQAYDVSTILKAGNTSSHTIVAHYVIRGESATIQSLSLDKNYYKKGDTAKLTLVWSPAADAFPNSRLGTSSISASFVSITLAGTSGACAQPIKTKLSERAVKIDIPLVVESDCGNPSVSVSLADAKGIILAKKDLALETSTQPASNSALPIIITLAVLAVLTFGIYELRKKKQV